MRYLDCSEVETICQKAIAHHGGLYGLRDPGGLESAVVAVQATWGGVPLLATLEEAAAAYWVGICNAHAFIDGNKRTALYSVERFLNHNGYTLAIEHDPADLTLRIAQSELSREELAALITIQPL